MTGLQVGGCNGEVGWAVVMGQGLCHVTNGYMRVLPCQGLPPNSSGSSWRRPSRFAYPLFTIARIRSLLQVASIRCGGEEADEREC